MERYHGLCDEIVLVRLDLVYILFLRLIVRSDPFPSGHKLLVCIRGFFKVFEADFLTSGLPQSVHLMIIK
jgi:hypothetical protein